MDMTDSSASPSQFAYSNACVYIKVCRDVNKHTPYLGWTYNIGLSYLQYNI